MSNYVIYTDSACDVNLALLKAWGVYFSRLTFKFNDEDTDYPDGEMASSEFFSRMRAGDVATTSAVNVATFLEEFENLLQRGLDILYIGFSSGVSSTYNSAAMAAEQLRSQYPHRKLITIDTVCISAGQAQVLYHTVEKKNAGATIEEAAAFAENLKMQVCHWITVDDLTYLKRGGRINPTTALVGKALGIKPLIYINTEGKLDGITKVRGRKKALTALADLYGERVMEPGSPVFISHSDCLEDAEELAAILKQRYNADTRLITDIGAVVGAHIGPGGMVFSFVGKAR